MQANEVVNNFTGINGMAYGIDTAIKALRPNCKFKISVEGGHITYLDWEDEKGLNPPTNEEVYVELDKQKRMAEYYQYAYDRCKEYPDGFEQLDMLWHAVKNGIKLKDSEWFKRIEAVKEKYPKPDTDPPV